MMGTTKEHREDEVENLRDNVKDLINNQNERKKFEKEILEKISALTV